MLLIQFSPCRLCLFLWKKSCGLCSLDYPGVGPEHSYLKDMGRAEYHSVTDEEALEGRASLTFALSNSDIMLVFSFSCLMLMHHLDMFLRWQGYFFSTIHELHLVI